MATYLAKGDAVDYTPTSAVAAGTVVCQGDLFGLSTVAIAANTLGSLSVRGLASFPKSNTLAVNAGDRLFWDATNTVMTATNTFVPAGRAVTNTANTSTSVTVLYYPGA